MVYCEYGQEIMKVVKIPPENAPRALAGVRIIQFYKRFCAIKVMHYPLSNFIIYVLGNLSSKANAFHILLRFTNALISGSLTKLKSGSSSMYSSKFEKVRILDRTPSVTSSRFFQLLDLQHLLDKCF